MGTDADDGGIIENWFEAGVPSGKYQRGKEG